MIPQNTLVSIIIPCYNNEMFVREAIDSALNQTHLFVEVVVVDDGSSDRSLDIVRSFGDRIKWEKQSNQGAPAARNRGLRIASGDYVKFLDADDSLLPDCIEQQMRLARTIDDSHKAIVYGNAVWVDRHLNPTSQYGLRPRRLNEDHVSHILTACPLTTCPLHKRTYLLEVGGFDIAIPRGQEHDLHLRLVLAGVEFIYHPHAIYRYRNYEGNSRISNRPLSKKRALVQYDILKKQQAMIVAKTAEPMSLSVRRAIAQRYWQSGREALREEHIAAAEQYFQAARELDSQNCIVGRKPYPRLARLLGPYRAEAILTRIKQLKTRLAG